MKKHVKPIFIFLVVAIFITSPIILNKTPVLGVDGYFHYSRLYESAMQIKHLNFSMLNLYSFQQSGRIVNALYSPFLTYLLSIILLVAGSWLKFQIIINILILFLAGLTTYYVSTKIGFNKSISIGLGIIYLASNAIGSFLIVSGWRSIGLALLPLIILPMIDMLQGNVKFKNAILLALAVSLQVQGHLLSASFAIPVLIAPFIIGFIKTQRKIAMVKYLITAIFTAIILCLNTILPYMQIAGHNTLVPPTSIDVTANIFNPFNFLATSGIPLLGNHISIVENILAILAIIGLGIIILFWKRLSILSRILIISGLVYFILGSDLTPWASIQTHLPQIMNFLQFSFRFTLVGEIFVLLGTTLAIKELVTTVTFDANTTMTFIVTILAIASTISLTGSVSSNVIMNTKNTTTLAQSGAINQKDLISHPINGHPVNTVVDFMPAWHNKDLSQFINTVDRTTPDYLPINKVNSHLDYYNLYTTQVSEKHSLFKKKVLPHGVLSISWHQNQRHDIEIPAFVYENTQVRFNHQQLKAATITKTAIGTIKVHGIKGYNELTLQYESTKLSTLLIIFSNLSWLFLIVFLLSITLRTKKLNTYRIDTTK